MKSWVVHVGECTGGGVASCSPESFPVCSPYVVRFLAVAVDAGNAQVENIESMLNKNAVWQDVLDRFGVGVVEQRPPTIAALLVLLCLDQCADVVSDGFSSNVFVRR